MQISQVTEQVRQALTELLSVAELQPGDALVVGCSSSEICGDKIGTASSEAAANAVFDGVSQVLQGNGIALVAQCCEHLNRALIVEAAWAKKRQLPIVNVKPQPKAGGSFASAAYAQFENPVAVEVVQVEAGIDIGNTLIGMHLKPVAVPVRLHGNKIGQASLVAARTRPKYIGGARAFYR